MLIFLMLCGWLASAATALGQTGVTIEVDQFGLGNMLFRAGDLTPIRLKLTSHLSQPTPVWVQWQVPNADGDIGEYGRSLTLTPNQPAFTWLYAPLPPDANQTSVWTVRVFEERDGERRGEIGGTRIGPAGSAPIDMGTTLLAAVGQAQLGLDRYGTQSRDFTRTWRPPGAHETTRIAFGMRPSQLPDRWFGLLSFEALAWSGDHAPQDLGLDQAEAVREYVRRGGHLIISLPAERNIWGLGVVGQTELEDLLPCRTPGRTPRTDEAVPLSDLLPVLSKYSNIKTLVPLRKPPEFTIRVFKDLKGDFNVIDNQYEPLIALPDGRVIVVQRQFGFGRVTVIGMDLSDGRLNGLDLPQPDAFWNRILGRRSDTPSAGELKAMNDDDRLGKPDQVHENSMGSSVLVTEIINMSGQAGKGLLLALMLFLVYWVLAGPGGFALLKHYGKVQHAWVAFALCAAAFTAVAWGGVKLFPKRVEISHVTILDHVARTPDDPRTEEPQYQRAISYFSAYMPNYGPTPISIASTAGQRDLLLSWTPPGRPTEKFPNIDRYRVDVARLPASASLPARSTATTLYAHWQGGLDREWGGTLLVDPRNPIQVAEGNNALRGRIINELPGALTNVTVIWVQNNRTTRRRYSTSGDREEPWVPLLASGSHLNVTRVWRFDASTPWQAGQAYDLSALGAARGRNDSVEPDNLVNWVKRRFIDPYSSRDLPSAAGVTQVGEQHRRNYMEMLSIFHQLNPPEYLKPKGQQNVDAGVAFHRQLGREWDLSAWFNRPCLIIMGFLRDTPAPIPLRVDDRENLPVSQSVTMVRWIYPLPLDEKIAFKDVFEVQEQE